MLSPAAWNAFLKTLEEPPSHVVFVLATTEAHKVPATIVDRCHRFDFRRPSLEQIARVLERVAGGGGHRGPDAGRGHARPRVHRQLPRRARHARAARDLRRQGGEARGRAGHPRRGRRRARARRRRGADRARPAARRCSTVERLSDSGRDITQFMRDLSAHLRHLFVVQTLGEVPDSFSVTAGQHRPPRRPGRAGRPGRAPAGDRLPGRRPRRPSRTASEPRIQLEMALLKATQPQADLSLRRPDGAPRAARGAARRRPAPRGGRAAPRARLPTPSRPPGPSQSGRPAARPAARAARCPRRRRGRAHRRRRGAAAEPATAIELDQVLALWPAVGEAVAEENGMLGAALSAARCRSRWRASASPWPSRPTQPS